MIQRGSAAARVMADKENKKKKARPSRTPRPAGRALQSQNSCPRDPTHQSEAADSRVKPVPDFAKLHRTLKKKIAQAKNKKTVTEFKTFDLTPSSSLRRERQSPSESEREIAPSDNEGERADICQPPENTDQPIGTLREGLPPHLTMSPGQIRQSVYSKRDRAIRRVLQSSAAAGGGRGGRGGLGVGCERGVFSQLLQRQIQTTLSSIRTIARREAATEAGLEGVKLKLEYSPPQSPEAHSSQPHNPLLTLHISTEPHPEHTNLSHPAPLHSFYCLEPELCAIEWGKHDSSERRPSCPVAPLLDTQYFIPVHT